MADRTRDEPTGTNGETKRQQHTVVDRSVTPFLDHPEETPSLKNGVSPSVERLHRLHGTCLLAGASKLLGMGASTYATSCAIFHRFYYRKSLLEKDVWSVAMASTLLAGKIEEEPRPIRHVILIYNHLYRRRRLCVQQDFFTFENQPSSELAKSLTKEEKENVLRYTLSMSPLGPIFQEWRKALVETESEILRQLGFTLYWIPDSHPHRFILYIVRVLEIQDEAFCQQAWNYCNSSCLLPLSVKYPPELIASAAIYMAAHDFSIPLPPRWWEVFVNAKHVDGLPAVCNAILGLSDEKSEDLKVAATTFMPSLVKGGSFNDPGSFLWSQGD